MIEPAASRVVRRSWRRLRVLLIALALLAVLMVIGGPIARRGAGVWERGKDCLEWAAMADKTANYWQARAKRAATPGEVARCRRLAAYYVRLRRRFVHAAYRPWLPVPDYIHPAGRGGPP